MLNINGIELDFDIMDADTAEKYEDALKIATSIQNNVQGMNPGESIRYQCNCIFDIFNTLFGPGTDKKLFGDKANLRICLEAFEALVTEANNQAENMDKKYSKYSQNRVQRRAKK